MKLIAFIVQVVHRSVEPSGTIRQEREQCERIEARSGGAAILLALASRDLVRAELGALVTTVSVVQHSDGAFVGSVLCEAIPYGSTIEVIAIAEPPRASEPPP